MNRLSRCSVFLYFTCLTPLLAQALPTEVYFTPFSHLDFFWGGTREECLARGNGIIAQAIRLAKQSPDFRFLLEDNVFVANYVETHKGLPELDDFRRLVREGRIEIAPKWVGIFQGLPDGEVHARNLVLGKRYARQVFGVDPVVAHLGDLPDYTPQFPQILAQVKVPFMVMTRMGPTDKSLFRWKGLDGSQVLVWNTLKGYGWGTFLTSKRTPDADKLDRMRKDLADVRATTDGPILMNWGTDLWSPPDDLVEAVGRANQSGVAKFILATPLEFFKRVEGNTNVPETSGEINTSWPNIVSSLPHLWPQIIPATNTLLTAEKFAAVNHALQLADYPQDQFDLLWKKLIESMDHNHDGQGGMTGDNRKRGYMEMAKLQGSEILRDMLRNIAERVQIPVAKSFPIVVFNPLGWTRTDVVEAHLTLYGDVSPADIADYKKGLRLLDETGTSIPFHVEQYSENISRAPEIVFIASGVPSLGYKTYYLVASDQPEVLSPAASVQLDREKDRRESRRALGSDIVENDLARVSVDRATGRVTMFDKRLNREVCRGMEIVAVEERGGNYIGIEPLSGRTIPSSVNSVELEDNNPIRTVVRIEGQIADIPIVQRVILYRGLNRVDLENTIVWRGPRLVRLQQLFPLPDRDSVIHYGVPFGANAFDNIMPKSGPRAVDEIKPDSWKQVRHIHDWIHAGTSEWGLTIAANQQLVKVESGLIRSEMLRGPRYTSVKVVRGQEVTSMQYPPAGTYVFRYSLCAAGGDWKSARSQRTGMDFNNPLIPVSVVDRISTKSLAPAGSFASVAAENLVISAVKKADGDGSVVMRLYETEGSKAETAVEFLGRRCEFRELNLLEEETGPAAEQVLRVGPYGIKTLKLLLGK
ncbi:MAG: glycoside hydrolase family 38 C-terminal domain-containing protein [Acidobacteriota bacterium]